MRCFLLFLLTFFCTAGLAEQRHQIGRFIISGVQPTANRSLLRSAALRANAVSYFNQTYDLDLGTTDIGGSIIYTIDFYSDPHTLTEPIVSVDFSGDPDFSIPSDGCTGADVGGAGHCLIDVEYKPTVEGPQHASVAVRFTAKFRHDDGTVDDVIGIGTFNFAATTVPLESVDLDSQNSCQIAANSSIDPNSLSLSENIALTGVGFNLSYASSRMRSASKFNPTFLGLGGWTPSNLHYYNPAQAIVYFGDGGLRNVTALVIGDHYVVSSKDGSSIYDFDSSGRHVLTRNAKTGVTLMTFSYDSSGRIASEVDQFGNSTSFVYDTNLVSIHAPFGQITNLVLDSSGHLASVTNPKLETYKMTNDSLGLLLKFKKPMGQESTVSYDASGRLKVDTGAGGDLLSFLRAFNTFTGEQFITESTTPGVRTFYNTSGNASLSKLTIYGSHGENSTVSNSQQGVNTSSNSYGETSSSVQAVDPRFGWMAPLVSDYSFNIAGSPIHVSYQKNRTATGLIASNPLAFTKLTETTQLQADPSRTFTSSFDKALRQSVITSPLLRSVTRTFNDKDSLVSLQIGGLTPVTFAYDPKGRMTKIAEGTRASTFDYNSSGNLTKQTDSLGRVTKYKYDAANHVEMQTLPDGRHIKFEYDGNGNLTAIKPPGRALHIFGFNLMDLVDSYVPPMLKNSSDTSTHYEYTLDRQLGRVRRPDGGTIDYSYNALSGLLESVHTPSGDYVYITPAYSRLLSDIVSPDSVRLHYTYVGQALSSVETFGDVVSKISYVRNPDLSVASLQVSGAAGASSINVAYDKDGLVIGAGEEVMTRNSFAAVDSTQTGVVTGHHTFNSFGEVLSDKYQVHNHDGLARTYTRDALGRIATIVDKVDPTSASLSLSYAYDPQGRLTHVNKNGVQIRQYTYDANGNRTQKLEGSVTTRAQYDAQDRLTHYGSKAYEYNANANGNLVKITDGHKITSLNYDVFGNLKTVVLPNKKKIEYLVDGQNRRVGKKVNGKLVRGYVYQSQTQIVAELNAQNQIVKQFGYGEKSNIPDYMITRTHKYRIISDQVGTPRQLIDMNSGKVAANFRYDEFGMLESHTGTLTLPFGFAGGLADSVTGLVRFGARDYDPEIGRWLSKDPILFNGGDTNLFGYVASDPVNGIDPSGLYEVCTTPLSGLENEHGLLRHQYLCANGVCGGQTHSGGPMSSPGMNSNDPAPGSTGSTCKEGPKDNQKCMDDCIAGDVGGSRPNYSVINVGGSNCQKWANDTVNQCAAQCGGK